MEGRVISHILMACLIMPATIVIMNELAGMAFGKTAKNALVRAERRALKGMWRAIRGAGKALGRQIKKLIP